MSHQSRAEQTNTRQSGVEQTGQVEQARTDQSRASCLAREGPGPKVTSQQGPLTTTLCCFIIELWHYWDVPPPCCITLEQFALYKISFFTTLQTGVKLVMICVSQWSFLKVSLLSFVNITLHIFIWVYRQPSHSGTIQSNIYLFILL